jgi:hypothetical protein
VNCCAPSGCGCPGACHGLIPQEAGDAVPAPAEGPMGYFPSPIEQPVSAEGEKSLSNLFTLAP